jgi:hypothetical protein
MCLFSKKGDRGDHRSDPAVNLSDPANNIVSLDG